MLDIKTSDKTNIDSGLKQTTLLGFEMEHWNKKIYPEKWDNYMKFTIMATMGLILFTGCKNKESQNTRRGLIIYQEPQISLRIS